MVAQPFVSSLVVIHLLVTRHKSLAIRCSSFTFSSIATHGFISSSTTCSPTCAITMVLQEGDRFADFSGFKTAMQDWGFKGQIKLSFGYQKSDSTRKIVVCAHAGCPFRIYRVLSNNKDYVLVATVMDEHTCVGAPPVKRGLATERWWLQEILPTVITVTKTTTPKQIIDAMALHHQVAISYQAA